MKVTLIQILTILLTAAPSKCFIPSSLSSPTRGWKTKNSNLGAYIANPEQHPDFGLYQVQEQLLVERGIKEEGLTAANATPLQVIKVKGVGSSGGFGGGGGKSSNSKSMKAEGKFNGKVLEENGVVRIDNVLSPQVAKELRTFVMDLRAKAEQEVKDGVARPIDRFADVLLRTNRCDLKLPLDENIVREALQEILCKSSVKATLETRLGTTKPILYELSSLISDPGSQRQNIHPDTPYLDRSDMGPTEPTLLTCFVAMQDITIDMGPTCWLPGTNTKKAHELFKDDTVSDGSTESSKDNLIRTTDAVLGLLPQGSCAIFDSRTLHCGSANKSEAGVQRGLFYFSFRNPKVGYPGNPGSIFKNLEDAQIDLASLSKELKKFKAPKRK